MVWLARPVKCGPPFGGPGASNNCAERMAGITALKAVLASQPLATASGQDSTYDHDKATLKMNC